MLFRCHHYESAVEFEHAASTCCNSPRFEEPLRERSESPHVRYWCRVCTEKKEALGRLRPTFGYEADLSSRPLFARFDVRDEVRATPGGSLETGGVPASGQLPVPVTVAGLAPRLASPRPGGGVKRYSASCWEGREFRPVRCSVGRVLRARRAGLRQPVSRNDAALRQGVASGEQPSYGQFLYQDLAFFGPDSGQYLIVNASKWGVPPQKVGPQKTLQGKLSAGEKVAVCPPTPRSA